MVCASSLPRSYITCIHSDIQPDGRPRRSTRPPATSRLGPPGASLSVSPARGQTFLRWNRWNTPVPQWLPEFARPPRQSACKSFCCSHQLPDFTPLPVWWLQRGASRRSPGAFFWVPVSVSLSLTHTRASSGVRFLFVPLAHFSVGLLVFFLWLRCSSNTLHANTLSVVWVIQSLAQVVVWLYTFPNFNTLRCIIFIKICTLGILFKNSPLPQDHKGIILYFPLKALSVAFTCES